MTTRPLPRSWRGRALPRSGSDTVTWPPALRGRSPLLCVLLLGWLGGGLLATVVALFTESPDDLAYGLTNTAAALAGLLLLAAAGVPDAARQARRRRTAARAQAPASHDEPLDVTPPTPVPAQAEPEHDARQVPALR